MGLERHVEGAGCTWLDRYSVSKNYLARLSISDNSGEEEGVRMERKKI